MPFYKVEQKGVPGARLIEADKPAGAINHVVGDTFTATRVDGRDLLEAAKQYDVEVAGTPPEPRTPPAGEDGNDANNGGADGGDNGTGGDDKEQED